MYISKLSKLNLSLMIRFHSLYDMLTSLLFRLRVFSLIFLPPHPPFFYFQTPSFKDKIHSLGKASSPVGGAPATSLKPRRSEKAVAAFSPDQLNLFSFLIFMCVISLILHFQ